MKKKGLGLTEATIIGVLLLIAGSAIASHTMSKFYSRMDVEKKEKACYASIRAREKARISIEDAVGGFDLNAERVTPLLCDPITIEQFPETMDATRDNVKRGLAEQMAKTWSIFGEGEINYIFTDTSFADQNCKPYYFLTIKDSDDNEFTKDNPITADELREYMWENSKDIYARNDQCYDFGGQCIPDSCDCGEPCPEDKKFHEKPYNENLNRPRPTGGCSSKKGDNGNVDFICCTSKNPCENKGGKCMKECEPEGTNRYDVLLKNKEYECKDKGMKCCIRSEDKYSYLEYIQSYKGDGLVVIAIDDEGIKPGETYAILFGNPTETHSSAWDTAVVGAGSGAAIGAAVVTLLIIFPPAGAAAAATATIITTIGGVAGGAAIGGVVVGGASAGVQYLSESVYEGLFKTRTLNTVYLVDPERMSDDICHLEEELGEDLA